MFIGVFFENQLGRNGYQLGRKTQLWVKLEVLVVCKIMNSQISGSMRDLRDIVFITSPEKST